MKITKAEDGTFTITGIAPDALTRLLITVNAADCMNCGLLYECKGSGVNCGEWQRFLKPVVLAELDKESGENATYHQYLVHRGEPAEEKAEAANKKYEKLPYR